MTDYRIEVKKQCSYLQHYKGIKTEWFTIFKPSPLKYIEKAEKAIGYELPNELKEFYLQGNGLKFNYWNRSKSLYVNTQILPIERVFGGWQKKKDGTLGKNVNSDWLIDVFNGSLWFDHYSELMNFTDFELIKKFKVLESIEGLSAWICIDFVSSKEHKLYLVYKTEIIALTLSFKEYIEKTIEFCGLTHWWALFMEKNTVFDVEKIKNNINSYFPHINL